jgi:nucleoside-diphosphate-sugar epimerase
MRIVVTGGAGFIGSHLVDALVRSEHQVLVLDDLSTGSRQNLSGAGERARFEQLDIRDRQRCADALAAWQPRAVAHLAAVASPLRSIEQPSYAHDVNLTGTLNILEASRLCGARRFVFPGSAAVYGPEPSLPSDETDAVQPVSPYAVQKVAGELLAAVYRRTWGLEAVSLRFFNVFGERQPVGGAYSGVISAFVSALRRGEVVTISGDGGQTRDFIHVADVVRAVVRALTGDDPGNGPYNIARGEALSVRRLHTLLAERLGAPDVTHFSSDRPGDVRHSRAKIDRMISGLGVRPEITVEAGIDRLLRWES